jgi:hypothetical protein
MATMPEFREKYNRPAAAEDATVKKCAVGTEKYWQTLGAACWSKHWTAEEKEAIKAEYEEWKQQMTRGAAAPNLAADAGDAAPSSAADADAIAAELGL